MQLLKQLWLSVYAAATIAATSFSPSIHQTSVCEVVIHSVVYPSQTPHIDHVQNIDSHCVQSSLSRQGYQHSTWHVCVCVCVCVCSMTNMSCSSPSFGRTLPPKTTSNTRPEL